MPPSMNKVIIIAAIAEKNVPVVDGSSFELLTDCK